MSSCPVPLEFQPAFCSVCWRTLPAAADRCPGCGADVAALTARPYTEKLLSALEHPIGEVRERAATLLGEVAGQEARDPLTRLAAKSSDPYLAAAALWGLYRLSERHPKMEPVNWRDFTAPDRPITVRAAAVEICRRLARSGGEVR
jgi:HEAT repeat protein